MKISMKKIINTMAVAAMAVCVLASCGSKADENVSGREIHKDGSVTGRIVREFDETLYSVDGLKSMMDEEIRSYNFDHAGEHITAGDVSCTEGILTCIMNYASAEDYAEFNTRRFVIESFEEAMASDLVKVSVKSVKDMTQTDLDTLNKTDDLYVLITDETGQVSFPGKVLYVSDGVESVSNKQINVTDNMDGLAYIVYENK